MLDIMRIPLHVKAFFYQLDIPTECREARDFDKDLRFREGCDECEFRGENEQYMEEDGATYTFYACTLGHWGET